ncbi:hypothetical protein HHK36_014729 [Tetracentron sinense]|uniref:Uncharacterized protein n=1 Tax=Tetracentron sinense TaxID=13715 RepID=A0A834Z3W5_TETSI|nr:hypothetical protein HHK36_014729 [Tetracentron sinense]
MADGTRLSQLTDSVNLIKESQQRILDELVQQLGFLATSYESLNRNQYRERGKHSAGRSVNRNDDLIPNETMGIHTRMIQLDFPRFDGTDPSGWLYRAHQFLAYHQTPLQQRLMIASFHLEGKALPWFHWMENSGALTSWDAFPRSLQTRFGPIEFDDPVEALTKLCQNSTVDEYQTRFENLAKQTEGLSEPFMEEKINYRRGPLRNAFSHASTLPSSVPTVVRKPFAPVQRLTQSQMKDRRDQGLCYNCDEKWTPAHRYPKPEISLHAIAGALSPQTMRLTGSIQKLPVVVLIDFGSTHNFLDPVISTRAGLPTLPNGQFEVTVANGEKLSGQGRCNGVTLSLQSQRITTDFYLLTLGGCDVVLGELGGQAIPLLGMGTAAYPFIASEATKLSVLHAIELGYRHFDTAAVYQSEKPLGEAICLGSIKSRDELFITSKLWCTNAHHHLVLPALQETLQNLQLEYIDLYLIHLPVSLKPGERVVPFKKEDLLPMDFKSVWEAMEECWKLGLTKSIGVSNFSCKKLEKLLAVAKIPPAVNQVEMNPLWQQKKLRQFCKEKGIHVTAYSPLGAKGVFWGTNKVMECEVLEEIARAKGKTVAQVCLRWVYEQGVSVLVKSFNKDRIKENLEIFDWTLSQEELQKIDLIPQHKGFPALELISDEGPYKSLEELWDGEINI